MKLQVLQESLSKALTITSRFASSRAQLPVLANIMLSAKKNKLLVSATNLEISISLSIGAKVQEDGEITVPARVITDLVSNLASGQMNLKSEKEQLKISTQGFSSNILGMNASDFPPVPHEIGTKTLGLPKEKFLEALTKVLFAVSIDEARPVLTGVLMFVKKDQIVLVATDGFRLSQKKAPAVLAKKGFESLRVILPRNVLAELMRLTPADEVIDFSFHVGDAQVIFAMQETILASRVIEGEFPDFEKIIPKATKVEVRVDKEEFLRAVKLASVFARDAANVVKLTVEKDSIEVSAESTSGGRQKTDVDAKVDSSSVKTGKEGFRIAFNYRFLEDFLNAVEGDEVKLEFSDTSAPGVFTDSKDPDFLHIIMPVRVSE